MCRFTNGIEVDYHFSITLAFERYTEAERVTFELTAILFIHHCYVVVGGVAAAVAAASVDSGGQISFIASVDCAVAFTFPISQSVSMVQMSWFVSFHFIWFISVFPIYVWHFYAWTDTRHPGIKHFRWPFRINVDK